MVDFVKMSLPWSPVEKFRTLFLSTFNFLSFLSEVPLEGTTYLREAFRDPIGLISKFEFPPKKLGLHRPFSHTETQSNIESRHVTLAGQVEVVDPGRSWINPAHGHETE
jgi:hypothetical protein